MSVLNEYGAGSRLARFDISDELFETGVMVYLPSLFKVVRIHPSNTNANAKTVVIASPTFHELLWGDWIPEIHPVIRHDGERVVFDFSSGVTYGD